MKYPSCGCLNNKSRGEIKIAQILNENNISYKEQYCFQDCKNNHCLPFDFYLPDYNICIEYDGKQHFQPVEYFGGEKEFQHTKINDKIKTQYCKDHDIKLVRIPY